MEVIAGCQQLNCQVFSQIMIIMPVLEEIRSVISDSLMQTGAGLDPVLP